jgi:hypothetical protein
MTKREPEFDQERVRDISVEVYKMRLVADSGEGAVERMLAKDGDTGSKLREVRAVAYDALTRCYMRAMGVK